MIKSDKEQRLLSASKSFDSGLSRFNLSAWDDVLASDVILHKDGVTLFDDLHGRNSVKGYFKARAFHEPRCCARWLTKGCLFSKEHICIW